MSTHLKRVDLRGMAYGRLTVLQEEPISVKGRPQWHCRCECGRTLYVAAGNLRTGNSTSCSNCARGGERNGRYRHGHAADGVSAEYSVWASMKSRCTNAADPAWHNYGGRGIAICDRWLSFDSFIADMGERPTDKHTLDREDNDGNYEPGNCRWATRKEQALNQRRNRRLTLASGETITLSQAAERSGKSASTIHYRLAHGASVEEAMR